MKRARYEKNLDGLDYGEFDELLVAGDGVIKGNLSVQGSINGGSGQGFYVATDTSRQYRTNASNLDLQVGTNSGTVRLLNSSNTVAGVSLQTEGVQATSISTGTLTATGTATTSSLTTGPLTGTTASFSGGVSANTLTASTTNLGVASGSSLTTNTLNATTSDVGTATATSLTTGTITGTSATFTGGVSGNTLSGTNTTLGTASASSLTTNTLTATSSSLGAATTSSMNTGPVTGTGATFSGTVTTNNLSSTTSSLGTASSTNLTTGVLTSTTSSLGSATATSVSTGTMTTDIATVGVTPINGGRGITVTNQSTGSDAHTAVVLDTDSSFNGVIFKNGSNRVTDGGAHTMTIRNDEGTLRLQAQSTTLSIGSTSSISSGFTTGALTTTSLSTGPITATSVSATSLTNTGDSNITGRIVNANTTDATAALDGAIYTPGGIKALKSIVANTGVQIPYGQPLRSDTTHVVQTKMLDADFNKAGGVPNDGLYLYTPGSTPGFASTNFVLGLNEQTVLFPQTTVSSSTTTGGATFAGGVGIAGNLNVGGSITGGSVSYSSTSSGTFAVTNGSGTTFTVASTAVSSSPSTGAAVFEGGVGIKGNLNVQGTVTGGAITYASSSTGTLAVTNSPGNTVQVSSNEAATSNTTGAVTVVGGMGVGRNLITGENVIVGQDSTSGSFGRTLLLSNTSTGTNASTGLLFRNQSNQSNMVLFLNGTARSIEGGGNVGTLRNNVGDLRLQSLSESNGGIVVSNGQTRVTHPLRITATTSSALQSDGGLVVSGVGRTGLDMIVGDTAVDGQRVMVVTNQSTGTNAFCMLALDSASTGSGVLFKNGPNRTADGGVNTMTLRNDAGTLRLQSSAQNGVVVTPTLVEISEMRCTSSTNSTSSTTGSITTAGGLGVAGNTVLGGTLSAGATTVTSLSSGPITAPSATFSGAVSVGSITVPTLTTGSVNATTGTFTNVNSSADIIVGSSIDGGRGIAVVNDSIGANASCSLTFDTAAAGNGVLFMNGPNRTVDGGPNTLTMRNDAGSIRLQSNTLTGITITPTVVETTQLTCTSTVPSTSTTTGSMTTAGGLGVAGNTFIGGVLNSGALTSTTGTFTGNVGVNSLTTTGNTGVGTNSPSRRLHVVDSNTDSTMMIENTASNGFAVAAFKTTTQQLNFGVGGPASAIPNLAYMFFGGATRLVMNDAGNVGIGTTSPSSRLSVNGDISVTGQVYKTINHSIYEMTADYPWPTGTATACGNWSSVYSTGESLTNFGTYFQNDLGRVVSCTVSYTGGKRFNTFGATRFFLSTASFTYADATVSGTDTVSLCATLVLAPGAVFDVSGIQSSGSGGDFNKDVSLITILIH